LINEKYIDIVLEELILSIKAVSAIPVGLKYET